MQHASDGLASRYASPAHSEGAEELPGDLQVMMELSGDARDHACVSMLLCKVEAGEQSPSEGYQVGEQGLRFGLTQPVEVDIRIRALEQLCVQGGREVSRTVPVEGIRVDA